MADKGGLGKVIAKSVREGRKPSPEETAPFRDELAILISDLSGFTRIFLQDGPEIILPLIQWMRDKARACFEETNGRFLKSEADNLFVVFDTPAQAVVCAHALNKALEEKPPIGDEIISICIGIGFGEVIWWGNEDIYGVEVNLASKLGEDTAGPREILLTEAAANELPEANLEGPLTIEAGAQTIPYFRLAQ